MKPWTICSPHVSGYSDRAAGRRLFLLVILLPLHNTLRQVSVKSPKVASPFACVSFPQSLPRGWAAPLLGTVTLSSSRL